MVVTVVTEMAASWGRASPRLGSVLGTHALGRAHRLPRRSCACHLQGRKRGRRGHRAHDGQAAPEPGPPDDVRAPLPNTCRCVEVALLYFTSAFKAEQASPCDKPEFKGHQAPGELLWPAALSLPRTWGAARG